MENKSVTEAVVKALAAYLVENTDLNSVSDDFPLPNQKLNYPCGSIFTGKPRYTNGMPYVVGKTPVADDPNSALVRRCIGVYEIPLQLDLWVDYKVKRHAIQEEIFKVLNPNPFTGLNLQLTDYFGEWAHFCILGFEFIDNGEASQRNEWRVRFSVMADVKAIVEQVDNTIQTIENTLETPNAEIPNPAEQDAELTI